MAEPAKDQLDALKRAIAERSYDEAIRDARRLVLESDKHPETQLLLGEALLAAGRNHEARVEMLALVRERPEESAAHRLLGEAYLRDRQLDPARASLRRAVELDPDDEAARDLLLEADSEVAAPMSSTVERWMGAAEPATMEMTMPEYLEEAPAMSPSASLRALLERAEPKLPAPLKIPKPSGVTAKMAPQPSPSTESLSVELGVDQDASTGQRAHPAAVRATARVDETGEISLDDLETASPAAPAPRPRSAPPPPPRTGSTSPGATAAPTDALTNVARLRPAARSSTLMGLPTPVGAPSPIATPTPPASQPRSVPPSAPPARPQSIPPSAPPPAGRPRSTPPAATGTSGAKPRLAPAPRVPVMEAEDAPTRPAVRSEEPFPSPPTVITGPQPALAGALLSPISADNVAITSERGSLSKPVAAPPSAAGTPGPWPPKAAIPAASPPPKLGSMSSLPSAAPTPYPQPQDWSLQPYAPSHGSPSPYSMPGPLAPEHAPSGAAGGRPTIGQGAPHLAGRQPGAQEPITKPTLRSPGARGEATQRIRLTQVTVALVLSGVVAAALLVAVTRWLGARERDEALAIASDNGTEADVVRALAATEGASASRARLFATATVELGEDRGEAAEALLASAAPGPETSVARSLLAISRGQATEALVMLEELQASGVTLAEGARARALALQAMGRFPEAQAAAGQAWGFRPAPRHACLLAHAAALAGDVEAAAATVGSIIDADARPCARVVRAEVAFARNDLASAETEATVVLGALAERATNADEAWAHHLRGRGAQLRGDVATARAEHRAAAELAPHADETLLLRALEGLLLAGDAPAAQELSARLTAAPPSPARRAELLVAIALERRDFAAADASLALLTPGARTALARGRILEARGSTQAALEQYAAATADPSLAVDASLRRARLLSRLGRDSEARVALEAGARTSPTDATLAAALAHAALATDDVRAARSAIEPALRAHADDVRLVALSALLRAREGDATSALATARTAAASATEDPEVQLDLVEVARLAGDRATETQACANALRLDPQRFAATVCTVRTALDAADFARATQLLEQARSAGAPEPALSRLRAELAVAAGHGALDVETVQTFLRTHRNDVSLLVSLARLQLQAEEGNDADDTARRILSLSSENPEALYVRAYAAYVDGHFGTSDELLDRAQVGARNVSLRARVAALRGMLAYEDRRYGNPQSLADEAIAADGRCATAHLLRALVASRDPSAQRAALEAAAQGTDTPAEAIGRLAMALGPNAQGCALAERYVRMAPDGYDRRDVDDIRGDCR
jgi:tetratricopeptide (TPR) repeat protein